MRILIDECLHTSLTEIANRAGHEAHHVAWRGWSGWKDLQLRDLAIRENFVPVTNNARDFRKLMAEQELHTGLIVIVPNVTPKAQAELFAHALAAISEFPDLINKVVEGNTLERETGNTEAGMGCAVAGASHKFAIGKCWRRWPRRAIAW